jgi:sialate O-acetylesterase
MNSFRISILCLIALSLNLQAALTFDGIFKAGMVIQQNEPIVFFGKESKANAKIKISFAGKSVSVKPDANGNWVAEFKPQRGSLKTHAIIATIKYKGSADGLVKIDNVRVGDVWLIAGERNVGNSIAKSPHIKAQILKLDNKSLFITGLTQKFTAAPSLQMEYSRDFRHQWQVCSGDKFYAASPLSYYFGAALTKKPKVAIGILQCYSLAGIGSWLPKEVLTDVNIKEKISKERGQVTAKSTSATYNGMVHPLSKLRYKGVIWYHGMSNVTNPIGYDKKLQTLIKSWREKFKAPNLPFFVVQAAAHRGPLVDKSKEAVAWLREAQALAVKNTSGTALIVTTDAGEYTSTVLQNIKLVADRLALWALSLDRKSISASSPSFKKVTASGGKIILEFNNAQGLHSQDLIMNKATGLKPGSDPTATKVSKDKAMGFSIAAKDGVFYPAEAKISGSRIALFCKQVRVPAAIRYGWASFPLANVFNGAGLPLQAFRTDKFDPPVFDDTILGTPVSMSTATGSEMSLVKNDFSQEKEIGGGKGFLITKRKGTENRIIFAKTFMKKYMNGQTKKIDVTLVYYDDSEGVINIFCDTSSYSTKNPKPTAKIKLTGTKKWLSTTIKINDAFFRKRINSAADVKLGSSTNDFIIGGVYLRKSK